jgi:hypothetical protein
MRSIYYDLLIDVLQEAGVRCQVNDINEGWERRSRSSGGFSAPPLGVCWHHTASSASVNSDLSYMINGSPDRPIGNMLLDRDGIVWPIAAGAANTQGKGGPTPFSRGTVPLDQGNTTMWGIEAQNNGVGQEWPQAQIDSYFRCNQALAELFGNQVTDCVSHQGYAPTRKIDPATAAAVQGPWRPGSVTSSGTWSVDDIRNEARRRSTSVPPPQPPDPQPQPEADEEYDMAFILQNSDTGEIALIYGDKQMVGLAGQDLRGYEERFGAMIPTDPVVWQGFKNKSM